MMPCCRVGSKLAAGDAFRARVTKSYMLWTVLWFHERQGGRRCRRAWQTPCCCDCDGILESCAVILCGAGRAVLLLLPRM